MTNTKLAVVQFGGADAAEIFESIIIKDVDWYVFDENSDIVFEVNELKQHYDKVYICNFKEVN